MSLLRSTAWAIVSFLQTKWRNHMRASAGCFQSLESAIEAGSPHCTYAKQSWVLGRNPRVPLFSWSFTKFMLRLPRGSEQLALGLVLKLCWDPWWKPGNWLRPLGSQGNRMEWKRQKVLASESVWVRGQELCSLAQCSQFGWESGPPWPNLEQLIQITGEYLKGIMSSRALWWLNATQ